MTLAERVRRRREETGISAAELARRAAISKGYLSDLEAGNAARPSGTVLMGLADALGTTIADLLGQEVRPSSRTIPPSLKKFAQDADLPEQDVDMLARIKFRGNQPESVDDWRFLYESIKRSIRGGAAR